LKQAVWLPKRRPGTGRKSDVSLAGRRAAGVRFEETY